jgi:DNA-directed RNA polymerase specialized sigma subunit
MAKEYVKNADLMQAIIESKNKGVLTSDTIRMFNLMIQGISKKMAYKDPEDKEDCMAFAMEDLCKYWDRFNPDKSDNAFSYFTQIAKNGFAKGWKKIHPPKNPKTIPFSHITGDDNSYNI